MAECPSSISNITLSHKTEFLSFYVFKSNIALVRTWKLVQMPLDWTELSRLVIQETSTVHPQVGKQQDDGWLGRWFATNHVIMDSSAQITQLSIVRNKSCNCRYFDTNHANVDSAAQITQLSIIRHKSRDTNHANVDSGAQITQLSIVRQKSRKCR